MTRVAIEVSSDFHYKSDHLENPQRLFFDIQGAKPAMIEKGMRVIAVGDALLKQIRIAETQPGVTRVVLDLEQHAEFTASQLSKPDRLMIELRLKDRPAPPAATSVTGAKTLTDAPLKSVAADVLAPDTLPPSLVTSAPVSSVSPPERRKFEPPPVRPVEPRPEALPEILPQPPATLANRAPKALPSFDTLMTARGSMSARNAVTQPLLAPVLPPPPGIAPLDPVKPELVSAKTTARPTNSAEPTIALPARSNSNGDRSLTRVLGLKLGRVVIDPGHGGHDAGTHGPSGLLEKDVVLDVAQRLGELLEERLGSEVIYTRTDDTYIPLEQRTEIANEHKADLFLSIHANSSPYRARGRRRDVLFEFHDVEDGARRGGARERELRAQRVRAEGSAGENRAEGQDRRIARIRHAHRNLALRAFGQEQHRRQESRREEGSLRGADRRADAERAGRNRIPHQRGRRGAAAEARASPEDRRGAL